MSAEDYGYDSYDDMIAHASHHGGGIDMDANAVEWVATELAALRQRLAELEAAQAIVTPNNCRHCQRAAERMREDAATFLDSKILTDEEVEDGIDWSQDAPQRWATDIRALPLPTCDGCNPLKPSQHDADML